MRRCMSRRCWATWTGWVVLGASLTSQPVVLAAPAPPKSSTPGKPTKPTKPAPPAGPTTSTAPEPLNSEGTLGPGSKALPTGELYQEYTLSGLKAGLLVSVTATAGAKSKEFAPYLIITPAGGTQIDRKAVKGIASGWFRAPKDGSTTILVTTEKAGDKGSFKLTVRYGAIEAELGGPTDTKLDTGEFSTLLPLWVPAGTYTVTVTTAEFGAYLICHNGEAKTEVERDLAQPNAVRAAVTATTPGFIGLQVTSRAKGEKGKFSVTLVDGAVDHTPPQTVTAKLAKGDAEEQGKLTDSWSFVCTKGHRYAVKLAAKDFGARLVVYDGAGERHEATAGLNAALVTFDNPADGTAQVMVQGLEAGKGGDYELRLDTSRPQQAPEVPPGQPINSPPAVSKPTAKPPVNGPGPSPAPPPVQPSTTERKDNH